jgi:putative hydrolase of the HAD superfamily
MNDMPSETCTVAAVLFDFGGVLAEEGFVNGLRAIALKNEKAPTEFVRIASDLVHQTGFVTGHATERTYWEAVRKKTGINGTDEELREEILSRFSLRPWMLDVVRYLKTCGVRVGILSDQTGWLDELDARHDFFRYFDDVVNSFHLGKSKKEPVHFRNVLAVMGLDAGRVLFVDDRAENCERARAAGMQTVLYSKRETFYRDMAFYCPAFGLLLESASNRQIH